MGYDWDKISADLSQIADVEREKPLAEMTSFGIGGPARIVAQPVDRDEIEAVIEYLWRNEVPFFVIGRGTN
ncbi:MAG TPA: UDP-N-acetylenolpyruvoylglucosamine reductase, partial [candidate division Zixibacteria bacterium]|nr:UDP-N-acetylenolpyruvoylglucosamine reductase [candidate division Zixibacteria bacterium]